MDLNYGWIGVVAVTVTKDTVDRERAKAWFEKLDGETLPPFKLSMRIDRFLKNFIFSHADQLLDEDLGIPNEMLNLKK